MPLMGLYCAAAAKRRERVMAEDARKIPEWADSPTAKAGIHALKDAIEAHLALFSAMQDLERKNEEFETSLSEGKTLRGILPICASCKKIRDDEGYWNQVESYF